MTARVSHYPEVQLADLNSLPEILVSKISKTWMNVEILNEASKSELKML